MSRNATGTMSLPAGNPVTGGTTIASSWANATLSDIATEITDSLDRSGKGGMLAQFKAFDGTAAAPGMSWANELDGGFYRAGAGDYRLQIAAATVMRWTAGTVVVSAALQVTSATGAGLSGTSGGGNGVGVVGLGNGSGAGVSGQSLGSGAGVSGQGAGAGAGVTATGGSSGAGLVATGGATNANGVTAAGGGTGRGVQGTGGATGQGVTGVGGATSGAGVAAQTGAGGATAALFIVPQVAPTGANVVGGIYCDTSGVLWICTVAGTPGTFVKVGTQT